MPLLQKNVASQVVFFGLVNASTGAALTGATFTAKAWVTTDGGAQAGFAGTFTELGNGQYKYVPTQGETNGNTMGLEITPTSAVALHLHFFTDTVDANTLVKVDVEDWKGSAVANAASGIPKVDIDTIKTNPVVNGGTITFPTTATLASTTNITSASGITVTTNNDKTGYSLTQSFPSNFATLSIDGSGNVATTSNVKKNTASTGFLFVMTDATTHLPKTGLTVTATRSIDGAAFGATSNSPSEVATGSYTINLSAADTNGNHIMYRFTATGADDLNVAVITQP